jgi:hypothetical protein
VDWLTFIATVIGSLAWPLAVVLLVIVLRKPIKQLFPHLQRLKYKEFELEFGKRVEEVRDEVARELPGETPIALLADESSPLARLAEVSPRSAVLEAWRDVELAALDVARAIGGESFRNKTLTFQAILLLEQKEAFDRNVISLLRDLRGLRNEAAHAPDFALTKEIALQYVVNASAVARHIRKLKENA